MKVSSMKHKTKKYTLVAKATEYDPRCYHYYTVLIYCNYTGKLLDCNDYFIPLGESHGIIFKQALSCYKLRQRCKKKIGA